MKNLSYRLLIRKRYREDRPIYHTGCLGFLKIKDILSHGILFKALAFSSGKNKKYQIISPYFEGLSRHPWRVKLNFAA